MWISKYDKLGNLSKSIQLNDKSEIISYYAVTGKVFMRFNIWDNDRVFEYQVADEEIELIENKIGERFFRCVSKQRKTGGINYPNYTKKISVENNSFVEFNVNKNKLKEWKLKAVKTN